MVVVEFNALNWPFWFNLDCWILIWMLRIKSSNFGRPNFNVNRCYCNSSSCSKLRSRVLPNFDWPIFLRSMLHWTKGIQKHRSRVWSDFGWSFLQNQCLAKTSVDRTYLGRRPISPVAFKNFGQTFPTLVNKFSRPNLWCIQWLICILQNLKLLTIPNEFMI